MGFDKLLRHLLLAKLFLEGGSALRSHVRPVNERGEFGCKGVLTLKLLGARRVADRVAFVVEAYPVGCVAVMVVRCELRFNVALSGFGRGPFAVFNLVVVEFPSARPIRSRVRF